ncbi:hypothetical protein OS189_13200 [Sulfitobacter sp. F26169L]|uniref:hypothetical protein n=1 Tax=Sulfitobacter sp. F26169L TaxID=2996015 RepID=UPI002260C1A1|nr:hypothetical protein [Sulfitobacter sp. F26169L]MCX7567303.1 hypothetical protein [Sulfitobacter sp. F26169L]
MYHFAFAIYSVVFSTISGFLAVAIILAGYFSWTSIITALIIGGIVALPVTYAVLKRMDWSEPDKGHAAREDRWYIR